MSIRIIGIGEYTAGAIDFLRCDRYSSVSYETIYNVEDLENNEKKESSENDIEILDID